MGLIDLPQTKWASGTGRQVILKSDFQKIEAALLEGFELAGAPALEYVDSHTLRVNATADSKARVLLCGFPSPLHRGQWVDGGLSDGRYRENAVPALLDLTVAASLWGTVKPSQWYGIYALAGAADQIFTLKAMPVLRVASVAGQVISLRNNGNSANLGYGFGVDELAGGQILVLSGASRGLARSITANNGDNSTGGTVTYDGAALTLAQGDWFVVLPEANFRHLGMVFVGSDGALAPFYQEGRRMVYAAPVLLSSGALNGFTLLDLGLAAPPTARRLWGFAAAANGYDLKLAVSYDGSTPALLLHGTPPTLVFQGVRGAAPFSCLIPAGHQLYLNNDNTANQTVKITGWQE
jgi:hypothetical protein